MQMLNITFRHFSTTLKLSLIKHSVLNTLNQNFEQYGKASLDFHILHRQTMTINILIIHLSLPRHSWDEPSF